MPKSDFDPAKARQELEEKIQKDQKSYAEVERLLTIESQKFTTLHFEGEAGIVDIRIKTALPYEVRERVQQIWSRVNEIRKAVQQAGDKGEIPDVGDEEAKSWNQQMYQNMADICLDEPWTDWEVWLYLDMKSGKAPQILQMMFKAIEGVDKEIGNFRKV